MTRPQFVALIRRHSWSQSIPFIANLDLGHTNPMAVWPIGGQAAVSAVQGISKITVVSH